MMSALLGGSCATICAGDLLRETDFGEVGEDFGVDGGATGEVVPGELG